MALRRQTGWGPRALSAALGRPASTIWRVLVATTARAPSASPGRQPTGMSTPRSGELVHLDIKKLGRFWQVGKRVLNDGMHRSDGAGWSYAHVAVDDHSRLRHRRAPPNASVAQTAPPSPPRVIAAYAEQGTPIQRILTDNGAGYRSHAFRDLLAEHGIRHIRTRPYTPRTNGKAEAFIRILQREWAYGLVYPTSTTAPTPSPAGCAGTTTTDHTAASTATHHSAASHTRRGPTPRRWSSRPQSLFGRGRCWRTTGGP